MDRGDYAKVYNAAWSKNWDFVPYTKADLDSEALNFQLVFDRDWFMVAEIDGQTVAVAITIPDMNQVLAKMNGRLLPFGWWHFLNRSRITDRVRIGFLGVLPEYPAHRRGRRAVHRALRHGRAHAAARPAWRAGSWRPTRR